MSIINDVLRDLDKKNKLSPKDDRFSMALGMYDEKPRNNYYVGFLIILSVLMLSLGVTWYIQANEDTSKDTRSHKNIMVEPEVSLIVANDKAAIKNDDMDDRIIEPSIMNLPIISDIQNPENIDSKKSVEDTKKNQIEPKSKSIVKVNKRNNEARIAKVIPQDNSIKKFRKPVYDYEKLLKESPHKIWPLIQSLNIDLDQSPSLLAIAAQAEQRTGNHNTAVNLYRRLLAIQPRETKWKIAAAISFDQLNETAIAQDLYLQSLQSNAISSSLRAFAIKRLEQFSSRGDDE